MPSERVFVLGGTGNIGTKLVQDLLAKNIAVTLYARTPSKVESLFGTNSLINIVQGDYDDLSALKEGIKNHTRLFLLAFGFDKFVETKTEVAKIAYAAGVKQIVDISSFTVNYGWRTSFIGSKHYDAEKAILEIPNRGKLVALRPSRFMANLIHNERPFPAGKIFDCVDIDHKEGWISTNDIGAVAAVVLSEDIAKHGDAVYSLTGDVLSPADRADIYSRVFEKEVEYQQITPAQKYHKIIEIGYFNHEIALDLVCGLSSFADDRVTPEISILLGREPETLEQFVIANKAAYNH